MSFLSLPEAFAASSCKQVFQISPAVLRAIVPEARYPWLERQSNIRTEWIKKQNRLSLDRLKDSGLLDETSDVIRGVLDKVRVESFPAFPDGSRIVLQNNGLGKTKEIILQKSDGTKEILFDTFKWKRNSTFNFVSLSISPSQRYLTITVAENGTIDDFRVILYDIKKRTTMTDELKTTHKSEVNWFDENGFILNSPQKSQLKYFVKDGVLSEPSYDSNRFLDRLNSNVLWVDYSAKKTTLRVFGGQLLSLEGFNYRSIVGVNGNDIFLLSAGENSRGAIEKITKPQNAFEAPLVTTLIPESNWVLSGAEVKNGYLLQRKFWGTQRKLDIYDLKEGLSTSIDLPPSLGLLSTEWLEPGKLLQLDFASPVNSMKTYIYDLKLGTYINGSPNSEMMIRESVRYTTEYLSVPSTNGAEVPVRLVYKEGTPRNRTAGALISVYGGFGINSGLHPSFNALDFEFLKRDGVLVFPGVRGGGEYGEDWHRQGQKKTKQHTIDDVIATARALSLRGISDSQKTVLTGWSHGGFVVAATAIQRPELFGLAIPGNGVHDIMSTWDLDARFNGWASEFGNINSSDISFMKKLSPVERAQQIKNQTRFLIMNGRQDSRVNSAHSFKLYQALIDNAIDPDRISLMSINNSGHWMTSARYQDLIAWRSLSVIWAEIYATTGIKP